jgi:sulfofructose kinase
VFSILANFAPVNELSAAFEAGRLTQQVEIVRPKMMPSQGAPNLIFCGAATMDLIYRVHRLPSGGGKILPYDLKEVAHGMASSAAAAAARLGANATLIARLGDDATAQRFVSDMEVAGVDCRHVRRFAGARSPLCTVLVDDEGERLIVPFYDPDLATNADWLPLEEIAAADGVLVDVRWPQAAAVVLDAARKAGVPALLDADVGPTETLVNLIERASHVVFSEPAALAVSGETRVETATLRLAERFTCFVAVTAGERGCFWVEDGRLRQLAPPPVKAVDTLAAGDVFHGAFLLGLVEGQTMVQTMAFANAAAALKCANFGGRLGAPTRAEVEAVLEGGLRAAPAR